MNVLALGAHLPWAQVTTSLDEILDLGLSPEIAIKGPELDTLDPQVVSRLACILADAGARPTVHAPFFDLNPGALDPLIRQATMQRLRQALNVAAELNSRLMVIHPGVDKWRYPNLDRAWLGFALEFFPPLVEIGRSADCRLAIENIYEETPVTLIELVDSLNSDWFGHCFDAGHWHLFSKVPMAEWLSAIKSKLFHLHLHDNHGRADEHLPVGDGTIDFVPLQQHLSSLSTLPSITLEAHSADHLRLSLLRVTELLS